MEERIVLPYRKGSRATRTILRSMLVVMAVFLVFDLVFVVRAATATSDPARMLVLTVPMAFMTLLPLLVLWLVDRSIKNTTWRFADDAFYSGARTQTPTPWSAFTTLKLSGSGSLFGVDSPLWVTAGTHAAPSQFRFRADQLDADDLQVVLAQYVARMDPTAVSPDVIVFLDILGECARAMADPRTDPRHAAACATARAGRMHKASKALERLVSDEAAPRQARGCASGLLAQCRLVLGDPVAALAECERAVKLGHGGEHILLCGGLAAGRSGDMPRAVALLDRVVEPWRRPVVAAAGENLAREGADYPSRATREQKLYAGVVVVALIGITLLMVGSAVGELVEGELGRWIRWGIYVATAGMVLLTVAINGWTVSRRSREANALLREYEETEPALPDSPIPVASERRPISWVWVAFATFLAVMVAMVGLQVLGTLRPDLLAGPFGEYLAPRVWSRYMINVGIGAMFVLVMIVGGGGLSRRVRARSGRGGGVVGGGAPVVSAPPSRAEGAPVDPVLNASIPTGYVVAAVGLAVVFAAGALLAAWWNPPRLAYVATDAAGDVYAIVGEELVRWDQTGARVYTVDLDRPPYDTERISDMSVDDSGRVHIADQDRKRVMTVGSAGEFAGVTESNAGVFQSPVDPGEWTLAVSGISNTVYVLDRGEVVAFGPSGDGATVFEDPTAPFASDLECCADGTLLVADPANGRLLRVKGDETEAIDCLGLEGEYRYPEYVTVSSAGDVYAVMRKPWEETPGLSRVGHPLPQGEPPDIWMGRLFRLDPESDAFVPVDLTFEGESVNISSVSFLPDGRMIVMPLNTETLYIAEEPAAGGQVREWTEGDLGDTLAAMSRDAQLAWVGPQALSGLAVVLPLGIGVGGAFAARRRRRR